VISTDVLVSSLRHSIVWLEWSGIWRRPCVAFGEMVIDGGDPIYFLKRKKLNLYFYFFEQYFYIPRSSSVTISSVKPTRFSPWQTYWPVSESDTESKSRIPFECWFGNISNVISFLNQYSKYRKIFIHMKRKNSMISFSMNNS